MQPNQLPLTTILHGVFLEILGLGVLLTGTSGIGKSELALWLINEGHSLIADDAVRMTQQDNCLIGECEPMLRDFIEVRGLGILNIRAMLGDRAVKPSHQLDLIANIKMLTEAELYQMDRLHGIYRNCEILGINIPEVTIPVSPGRNLAILIECAVRNQILKLQGYDACKDFANRQLTEML